MLADDLSHSTSTVSGHRRALGVKCKRKQQWCPQEGGRNLRAWSVQRGPHLSFTSTSTHNQALPSPPHGYSQIHHYYLPQHHQTGAHCDVYFCFSSSRVTQCSQVILYPSDSHPLTTPYRRLPTHHTLYLHS